MSFSSKFLILSFYDELAITHIPVVPLSIPKGEYHTSGFGKIGDVTVSHTGRAFSSEAIANHVIDNGISHYSQETHTVIPFKNGYGVVPIANMTTVATKHESKLLDIIKTNDKPDIQELAKQYYGVDKVTDAQVKDISALGLQLEIKGKVAALAGGKYAVAPVVSNLESTAQETPKSIQIADDGQTKEISTAVNEPAGIEQPTPTNPKNENTLFNHSVIEGHIAELEHELNQSDREADANKFRTRSKNYKNAIELSNKLSGDISKTKELHKIAKKGNLTPEQLSELPIAVIGGYLGHEHDANNGARQREWQQVFNKEYEQSPDTKQAKINYVENHPKPTRATLNPAETNGDENSPIENQPSAHIENGKAEPATQSVVSESMAKSKVNAKRPFKEVKEDLLKQIDAAIAKAPHAENMTVKDVNKFDATRTTFDIEGDGKFTVRDFKATLQEFRNKVERGFSEKLTEGKLPKANNSTRQANPSTVLNTYINEALKAKDDERIDAMDFAVQIADDSNITDDAHINKFKEELKKAGRYDGEIEKPEATDFGDIKQVTHKPLITIDDVEVGDAIQVFRSGGMASAGGSSGYQGTVVKKGKSKFSVESPYMDKTQILDNLLLPTNQGIALRKKNEPNTIYVSEKHRADSWNAKNEQNSDTKTDGIKPSIKDEGREVSYPQVAQPTKIASGIKITSGAMDIKGDRYLFPNNEDLPVIANST